MKKKKVQFGILAVGVSFFCGWVSAWIVKPDPKPLKRQENRVCWFEPVMVLSVKDIDDGSPLPYCGDWARSIEKMVGEYERSRGKSQPWGSVSVK